MVATQHVWVVYVLAFVACLILAHSSANPRTTSYIFGVHPKNTALQSFSTRLPWHRHTHCWPTDGPLIHPLKVQRIGFQGHSNWAPFWGLHQLPEFTQRLLWAVMAVTAFIGGRAMAEFWNDWPRHSYVRPGIDHFSMVTVMDTEDPIHRASRLAAQVDAEARHIQLEKWLREEPTGFTYEDEGHHHAGCVCNRCGTVLVRLTIAYGADALKHQQPGFKVAEKGKPHPSACSCPRCNGVRKIVAGSDNSIQQALRLLYLSLNRLTATPTVIEVGPDGGFLVGRSRSWHTLGCNCPNCKVMRKTVASRVLPVTALTAEDLATLQTFKAQEEPEEDEREELRRRRIARANRGRVPWNKGRQHSEATLKLIRERSNSSVRRGNKANLIANLVVRLKIALMRKVVREFALTLLASFEITKIPALPRPIRRRLAPIRPLAASRPSVKRPFKPRKPFTAEHRANIAQAIRRKWKDNNYRKEVVERMTGLAARRPGFKSSKTTALKLKQLGPQILFAKAKLQKGQEYLKASKLTLETVEAKVATGQLREVDGHQARQLVAKVELMVEVLASQVEKLEADVVRLNALYNDLLLKERNLPLKPKARGPRNANRSEEPNSSEPLEEFEDFVPETAKDPEPEPEEMVYYNGRLLTMSGYQERMRHKAEADAKAAEAEGDEGRRSS